MLKSKWTNQEVLELKKLQEKGKTYGEIAEYLNKTYDSVRNKVRRTNWDRFEKKQEKKSKQNLKETFKPRKWTNAESHQLYAYLQAEKSYKFIAKKLGRSVSSVEKKAQTTKWDAWLRVEDDLEGIESEIPILKEDFQQGLIDALGSICRHSIERLEEITEEEFREQTNVEKDYLEKFEIRFSDIKKGVISTIEEMGLNHPLTKQLDKGTYVVVGDSHGRETKNKVFNLVQTLNKYLKAKHVIHVGHLLDDDNNINYNLGQIDNLLIVARKEELRIIKDKENKQKEKTGSGYHFNMVRSHLTLGNDLTIENNDLITDYTKKPLKSLDPEIMDTKTIINSHRHEFASKCSPEGEHSYFVSPGCLCEKHVVKTIKQIDFKDISKNKVKVAYHDSFQKYRRMEKMYNFWKQGLLVVHVDSEGNHTIVPCTIKKVENDYALSYYDKIITSKKVVNPDKKIFIHADAHSPKHDASALSIQEQICQDYQPDVFVNIGDANDFSSLNHHDMDKNIPIIDECVLEEGARVHHMLKLMSEWAQKSYIIIGNHERFAQDFIRKYPQFKNYLDFNFICNVESLGYEITPLKKPLKIGPSTFIHGDLIFYNQSGDKLEKASRTYGKKGSVFIGHIHQPGIRFNSYSIGFSGLMDQGYNEPSASTWIHGFGLCNQYKGVDFGTSICITEEQCLINGKKYIPKNVDKWDIKGFNAKLVYETE